MSDLQKFQKDIDGLMKSLFGSTKKTVYPTCPYLNSNEKIYILCNMVDKGTYFKIVAEVPGVPKDKITIVIKDNKLIIRGEKEKCSQLENEKCYFEERSYGNLERSIIPNELCKYIVKLCEELKQ